MAKLNHVVALTALSVLVLDQMTKLVVLQVLGYAQEKVVIDGFFKFVHWGNTGAAWSLFRNNNDLLAIISLIALLVLFLSRNHFDTGTFPGKLALGMLFGGISGNLLDRLLESRRHVIDFIYFYVNRRDGSEVGFPAFNVADSAICVAVALLFILSWQADEGNGAGKKVM